MTATLLQMHSPVQYPVLFHQRKQHCVCPHTLQSWLQIGSFGGITPFQSLLKNRADLWDVAAAGPIAGIAASAALLAVGLSQSHQGGLPPVRPLLVLTCRRRSTAQDRTKAGSSQTSAMLDISHQCQLVPASTFAHMSAYLGVGCGSGTVSQVPLVAVLSIALPLVEHRSPSSCAHTYTQREATCNRGSGALLHCDIV